MRVRNVLALKAAAYAVFIIHVQGLAAKRVLGGDSKDYLENAVGVKGEDGLGSGVASQNASGLISLDAGEEQPSSDTLLDGAPEQNGSQIDSTLANMKNRKAHKIPRAGVVSQKVKPVLVKAKEPGDVDSLGNISTAENMTTVENANLTWSNVESDALKPEFEVSSTNLSSDVAAEQAKEMAETAQANQKVQVKGNNSDSAPNAASADIPLSNGENNPEWMNSSSTQTSAPTHNGALGKEAAALDDVEAKNAANTTNITTRVTESPTRAPTAIATTEIPTTAPTRSNVATKKPTLSPTLKPSKEPTLSPTSKPSKSPTAQELALRGDPDDDSDKEIDQDLEDDNYNGDDRNDGKVDFDTVSGNQVEDFEQEKWDFDRDKDQDMSDVESQASDAVASNAYIPYHSKHGTNVFGPLALFAFSGVMCFYCGRRFLAATDDVEAMYQPVSTHEMRHRSSGSSGYGLASSRQKDRPGITPDVVRLN